MTPSTAITESASMDKNAVVTGRGARLLPPIAPLRQEMKATKRLGLAIIFVFFVLGGGWAATAPLSGAVIANGSVSPEGSHRIVQHLEGGIIRSILVADGDEVSAGQTLLILEDIGAKAEVGTLTNRLRTLAATEARLQAERVGAGAVVFDHPALANVDDPEISAIIGQQIHQFETRRANDDTRVQVLNQQIAQLGQQIAGAQRQLTGVRRQRALIAEELKSVRELYEKGYERKPRMLELQRTEAGLLGSEGELVSQVARNEEEIGEAKLEIINTKIRRREDVDRDLAQVQSDRFQVEQQIKESLDKLARTKVAAPIDGIVMQLRFKTIGGVIKPGEPILDLVPTHEDLIVDARISTRDIDEVHAGLPAYVMFPSYPQRNLMRIDAKVDSVSADSMTDERTGERYFLAKVRIDRQHVHDLAPNIELVPGMPAEVFVQTVERTFLGYLMQPVMLAMEHTIREH
ncbi:MAG: HlyD family type I secretion periplasmic adaptor subunit [Rhodospirillales bacterium]|nr:HlyD family type I secretion periplasmic adaptor subunit [Rhodospirillales bacterium]